MIIFKKLKWSNFFIYGDNNEVDFTESPVTQIIGNNGVGKTSIPIILQEITYSKNVKKIVKADLANRDSSSKTTFAELTFSVDTAEYKLTSERQGAKLSVELIKDGEDISSHTAPDTLKSVENILGIDFSTFSQLVYQSSKSSMQFLTATDTQRKKFLISLFNLGKYTDIHNTFKQALVDINLEVSKAKGRFEVYESWLEEANKKDLIKGTEEVVPIIPEEPQKELTELEVEQKIIVSNTKRINTNNTYKYQLSKLDKELISKTLNNPVGLEELKVEKTNLTTSHNSKIKMVKTLDSKSPICPSCKQEVDISDSVSLSAEYRAEIENLKLKINDTNTQLKSLIEKSDEDKRIAKEVKDFENLTNLIDDSLPEEITCPKALAESILALKSSIKLYIDKRDKIVASNTKVANHNSKIDSIVDQQASYSKKLNDELNNLEELFTKVNELTVLKDAFSTNGLVSYKLEYLAKDLEVVINEYLVELSKGKFSLNFILKGDKLNIDVLNNGKDVSINTLSEGELSKVNVATLLAIRKLMQNLSNTKLNILFLDEIMGVLDKHSRDDLINVLLEEDSLNTFLVTHEYIHPLVPTIEVINEKGISRLET